MNAGHVSYLSRAACFAMLISAGSIVSGADLTPLAYDGFSNGPRADLAESSGGSGWIGAWQDWGASIISSIGGPETGLSAPGLSVEPGAAITPGRWLPDMTEYGRQYPPIGGNVMYVSCLMRPEADMTNWQMLRFGGWPRQVDLGIPIGSSHYGLMIGDGLFAISNVPAIVGRTVLLVLKIEHSLETNRTIYSLYVDPPVRAPEPEFPSATFGRVGIMPFGNFVELRGEGGYSLDEVRIGETWGGVTPVACAPDFDRDGFVTGLDFDSYVQAFEGGEVSADFDRDGFITGIDFDQYVAAFQAGC